MLLQRFSILTQKTKTVLTNISTITVLISGTVMGSVAPFLLTHQAAATPGYSSSFESDTSDWTDTSQEASGTAGITASNGSYYADAANGAYTKWGSYESTFPLGGYTTKVDVYLDMSQATGSADKRFDFSSAINDPSGNFHRDFIFHLGTNPGVSNHWAASVSNNAPGNPLSGIGSSADISATGWYTLSANFHDNGSGVLAVTMSVIRVSTGTTVGSWTLSDPSDVIGSTIGGNRYGWLVDEQPVAYAIPSVAIDNASLTDNLSNTSSLSGFIGSPKYVRENNDGDLSAQVVVPAGATNVRFTVDGSLVTDSDYTDNTYDNDIYKVSGSQWYRLQKALAAGAHTITAEFEYGGAWYGVTGSGIAYSLGTPSHAYVFPTATAHYFRPSDNPVRVTIGDPYSSFTTLQVNVYSYDTATSTLGAQVGSTYVLNRADCDTSHAGSYVTCNLNASGTWSNLAEGTYEVNLQSKDLAQGGLRFTQNNYSLPFTIDSTRPTLSGLTITNPHAVYSTPINVESTASDNVGVKNVTYSITAPRAADGVCDGSGTSVITPVVVTSGVGGVYSASLNTSGLNGTYCIDATAADLAANHSLPVLTTKVVIDNDAPTVAITSPSASSVLSYANDGTVVVRGSVNDANLDHYYLHISGPGFNYSTTVYTTTSFTDQALYNWNLHGLSDGDYVIDLEARDAAGNKDAGSVQKIHVTIDNSAPQGLANSSPADGTNTTTAGLASISWDAATDAHGPVTYYYESSTSNTVNGDGSFTSPAYTSGALTTNSIATSGTPEGTYYWHVMACDAVGNCTAWTSPWEVVVDNTAPSLTVSDPSSDITRNVSGDYTVSGTASDNLSGMNRVALQINDITGGGNTSVANIKTHTFAGVSWAITIPAGTLLDGHVYRLSFTAYDNSNNHSVVVRHTVTVDNTAPSVTILSYGQNGNVFQPTVSVDGSTTPTGYTYSWTTNPNVTISNTSALNPTFTINTDGAYTLSLTVTDAANNSTSVPFTISYTTPAPAGGQGGGSSATTTNNGDQTTLPNNGNGTTSPQVLGTSTTAEAGDSGNVKGDATSNEVKTTANTADKHGSNNFLGLGWWWLLVLAALAFLWWLIAARRRSDEN